MFTAKGLVRTDVRGKLCDVVDACCAKGCEAPKSVIEVKKIVATVKTVCKK